MEIEVKLRLQDASSHQSLTTFLSPFLIQTHFQHNIFFDGASSELSSRLAILRLRFYGEDLETAGRCVVCLKAKAVITDGVSRVEEDEEEIDPSVGRAIWADPNQIGLAESRVLRRVRDEFGVKDDDGYVCLGGFKNVRGVYDWNGLKLEVDQTLFDFGTLYEVECESAEPDKAKELIEGLLKENGISYSYSKMSKFAIFRAGKLPPTMNLIGGEAISVSSNDIACKPLWQYVTKLQKFGGGGNISFRCNYCKGTYKGSYSRVKAHLLRISGHGIKQCPNITAEQLKEMLMLVDETELRMKKPVPQACLLPPPPSSQSSSSSSPKREIVNTGLPGQELLVLKKRKTIEHLDFDKPIREQAKEHLDGEIARMFFSAGLPFSLAENPYYKSAFTYAANNDVGCYAPPDHSYLTNNLLEKEKANMNRLLGPIKVAWSNKGVTIVCSGWTNPQRSLVNFMAVTMTDRPVFLRAVSCGAESKDKMFISRSIKEAVMEVGPANVIQVITENAPACKQAGLLIEDAYPPVFWTPCLAHTLDLALRSICCPKNTKDNEVTNRECSWIGKAIACVKKVINFFMNDTLGCSLFNEQLDIKTLSLSETQLGYVVLLLRRLNHMKADLLSMVRNEKWSSVSGNGSQNARFVEAKLLDDTFWEKIQYILSFTEPIYEMIKHAITGKPCLHLVYEMWGSMIAKVKAAIYTHEKKEANEESLFWNVVHRILKDEWMRSRSPLYGLAHTLNPRYSCKQWLNEDLSHIPPYRDPEISSMRKVCLKRYFPDEEERRMVNIELCKFFESEGGFSDEDSLRDRWELDAWTWWVIHGASTPLLQNLAIRLLGQPSSSWSSEQKCCSSSVHKTKGQIISKQDADMLFVHMNLRLLSRTPQPMEGENKTSGVCGDSFDSNNYVQKCNM